MSALDEGMARADSADDGRLRAEDFLTAFNSIDAELKRRTGIDSTDSFWSAARAFLKDNPWWQRDGDAVLVFAELRNVIVHQRYKRYEYLSLPSREVVAEIAAIRDRLLEPPTALAAFGPHNVVTVGSSTPLQELLGLIEEHGFTQFPVYGDDGFAGLVTSIGIAHWLAQQVGELPLLDFEDLTVASLLSREEERPNWYFVRRETPVDEVVYLFGENPQLEAVLITENGRQHESPLGIATTSDIASVRAVRE